MELNSKAKESIRKSKKAFEDNKETNTVAMLNRFNRQCPLRIISTLANQDSGWSFSKRKTTSCSLKLSHRDFQQNCKKALSKRLRITRNRLGSRILSQVRVEPSD